MWGITLVFGVASALQGAVVVDRLAVVVNKQDIKLSDINRDLRVTEFLNSERPDFSPAARKKAAERLIEQMLLRDQISRTGFGWAPQSEADAFFSRIRQERFAGSDARLHAALTAYGSSEEELRSYLQWQLTVLRYINQRFRGNTVVTDDEVRAYYDSHLAELKREYPQNNSLEALTPKIRTSLEGERVNQNYAESMDQARKRATIRYLPGAFQ